MLWVRNIWQFTKKINIDPSGEVSTPFGLSLSMPIHLSTGLRAPLKFVIPSHPREGGGKAGIQLVDLTGLPPSRERRNMNF